MRTRPSEGEGRSYRPVASKRRLPGVAVEVVQTSSEVGGGSLPDVSILSCGLSLLPARCFRREVRTGHEGSSKSPLSDRIEKGRFLIDARTVQEEDEAYLPVAVSEALRDGR